MKKLCYIGENNDYSDKWLINRLSDEYMVEMLSPDKLEQVPNIHADLWINRMYVSFVERYGTSVIPIMRNKLKLLSPMINSCKGWDLESNRIYQNKFFTEEGFCYVPTFNISERNAKTENFSQFPIIIKRNISGRNKTLPVVKDKSHLEEWVISSNESEHLIVQPLISQKICYRTEFVGTHTWTYRQHIKLDGLSLSFTKEDITIENPADFEFYQGLSRVLSKNQIKCFSVEYFIEKNKVIIVDFNMTSNYSEKLIKNIGQQLIQAWKEIIQNEI